MILNKLIHPVYVVHEKDIYQVHDVTSDTNVPGNKIYPMAPKKPDLLNAKLTLMA